MLCPVFALSSKCVSCKVDPLHWMRRDCRHRRAPLRSVCLCAPHGLAAESAHVHARDLVPYGHSDISHWGLKTAERQSATF